MELLALLGWSHRYQLWLSEIQMYLGALYLYLLSLAPQGLHPCCLP